jgi:hypothetical protein
MASSHLGTGIIQENHNLPKRSSQPGDYFSRKPSKDSVSEVCYLNVLQAVRVQVAREGLLVLPVLQAQCLLLQPPVVRALPWLLWVLILLRLLPLQT